MKKTKREGWISNHGCLAFFIMVGLAMLIIIAAVVYVKMGIPLVLINPKM